MEPQSDKHNDTIKVAIRIRPLVKKEIINQDSNVVKYPFPGEPQLRMGEKEFRFDYVFSEDSKQTEVYTQAVKPLVSSFLKGYNTTIFAYGQTGSGKTYSMGTHGSDDRRLQEEWGIIPTSIQDICKQLDAMEHHTSLTASFVEIYREEVRDLLGTSHVSEKIKIVEEENGGVGLRGCEMAEVQCYEDLIELLDKGASRRQTGETSMNNQSSRSHAIFTIYLQQVRENIEPGQHEEGKEQPEGEIVTSKFHFVDLAGSERAKMTETKGERFKEGIAINSGLLALGNVIACLSQTVKARHVPFRDSKVTRLLQDSLGGNSLTIMIACLSPAGSNIGQSINTLNYANRAKMIKNKPVVNVDARSKEIVALRDKIKTLEAKLRGDEGGQVDDAAYSARSSSNATKLMAENAKLREQLETAEQSLQVSQEKLKELRKDISEKQDMVYENLAKSRELEMKFKKAITKLQSLDNSITAEEFQLSTLEMDRARKAVDMERENQEMKRRVQELKRILAKDQFALTHLQSLTRMAERFNEGEVDAFDEELRSTTEGDCFSPTPMDADEFKDEGKAEEELSAVPTTVDDETGEDGSNEDISEVCEGTEHKLLENLEADANKTEQSFVEAKQNMEKREKEHKINSEVIGRDITRTNRQIVRLQEIMRAFSQKHQIKVQRSQQNEMKMKQLELDLQTAEDSRRKLELEKLSRGNLGTNQDHSLKMKLEQSNTRIRKLKETLRASKLELKAEKKALAKQLKHTRHLNNLRDEMGALKRKKVNLQKQLKADNKCFALWKSKHQQLVNQLNKKVRQKSLMVRQTKTKIGNIKRILKEKTEKNASLTRQLREVRKENLRRTKKSTPHLKRRIQMLAQKLKDRDKVVRKMLVLKSENKSLKSEISSTKKESCRVQLILKGWLAVPEEDRDNAQIQRLEQDQLRVNDQLSEIDAQFVQNECALMDCDKNLSMLTRPNSYRKILKTLDFLQKEMQSPRLLSKKMSEVTKCTLHDISDIGVALPGDGARVAVILSNMLLAASREMDASEKKRGETEAEILDIMSENQRLSRDRKNWEERYRAEIFKKGALEAVEHYEEEDIVSAKQIEVNCIYAHDQRSSKESLSISPNSEAILSFPDNNMEILQCSSLKATSNLVSTPEAKTVPKVEIDNSMDPKQVSEFNMDIDIESSMDIWGSKRTQVRRSPVHGKLESPLHKEGKTLEFISTSTHSISQINLDPRQTDKVRRVSFPGSIQVEAPTKNCFDRLASPSGWTGTHKVTACQLPINQARVRVKKKLEAHAKKRKAEKAVNGLKRQLNRNRRDYNEMSSPPKKTLRMAVDDRKRLSTDSDGPWSRLHSTKIGHAKHPANC